MFRIGILGSDNSHAEIFSKIINFPDPVTGEYVYPDCKVVGIFGLEKERTEQVARDGGIEFISKTPKDLMGKVDAVMTVFRHGDLHLPYALPFIEAGIPTWIDKPFTVKTEDARRIIEIARKRGTLIDGGSTTKHTYDTLMLKQEVQEGSRIGRVKTAVLNFPADVDSEYAGIHFYGPHLTEITLATFGYNPKSVIASMTGDCVTAILKYDNYQVIMNFIKGHNEYYAILYGEKGTIIREIDISITYKHGLEKFINMLRTNKMPMTFEQLYAPVEVLNSIEEAYKTNKEVKIKSL
ncbi:Gfo/Idh/MocA family protein [Xylanivirga thermophila]|uniref:Gfo/Idh/MocA family protein n=1 Tax=Xylanivirga thermophila TaxID=2496273 RepID=UPI0013EB0B04|nr:Gfo/Idh/MocA family oxidoreductase [Xylanivirga thermophila]